MRRYETVFIANSELTDENRQSLLDKLQGLLPSDQAMLVKLDAWGNKRLAYEVKKQTRGYYVLMDYCGDGVLVKELERNMRLDDRILKYMTVLKDKTVDMEAIKAEMEAAKAQAESATPTADQSATETADEYPRKTADEPATQTADERAAETADDSVTERADEAISEPSEAAETALSQSGSAAETTESSDQEEQEDETT